MEPDEQGIKLMIERDTVNYNFEPPVDPAAIDLGKAISEVVTLASSQLVNGLTVTIMSNGVSLEVIAAFCTALDVRNPAILALNGRIISAGGNNDLIGQELSAVSSTVDVGVTTINVGVPTA